MLQSAGMGPADACDVTADAAGNASEGPAVGVVELDDEGLAVSEQVVVLVSRSA